MPLLRFARARNDSTMTALTPTERDIFAACLRKLRAHTERQFAAVLKGAAARPAPTEHKRQPSMRST